MKKLLVIALIALPCLVPAAADAKLTPRKPAPAVICGAKVQLGASTRHHHGKRKIKVRVYQGIKVVYKRTFKAPKKFGKRLACGHSYRIVYTLPSGKKVTRLAAVLGKHGQLPPPAPALPIVGGGGYQSSPSYKPTPAEQQQDAEADAWMDAMEACDKINEGHEDDEDWDVFACWPADPDDSEDPADDGADDE